MSLLTKTYRLRTLLCIVAIVCTGLAAYLYCTGEHLAATVELPDGTVLEIYADNLPGNISRGRRDNSFWGRRFNIATNSEWKRWNELPGLEMSHRTGTYCTEFTVPESSVRGLDFEVVSSADGNFHAVFEKQFPKSIMVLFDSTNRSIWSSLCGSNDCYGKCILHPSREPDEILEQLNQAHPGANFELHRCGMEWHHSPINGNPNAK